MINRMLWVAAIILWGSAGVMAQDPAYDPGIRDTMYVSSAEVDPGEKAVIELSFVNDEELGALTIPMKWNSPDISLDSVSFLGSRIAYVGTKPVTIDNDNQTLLFGVIIFLEPNIQPGSGLMATLYFDVPPGTPDQFVTVDSTTIPPAGLLFTNPDATNFIPEFRSGTITIGEPSLPPHIEVDPASLSFEAIIGFPPPLAQVLSIANSGDGTLTWTASVSSSWLTVNPPGGAAPTATSINVSHAALSAGTYYDTIVISSPEADNSPQRVPVQLEVTQLPPHIVVTPTSFSVSAIQGGLNPDDRFLYISTDVPGSELNWTVSNSSGWLTLAPTAGSPPDLATLSFDISGLAFGMYYDTVVVSDPSASNDPVPVPVTLQIVSDLPVLELDPDTVHVVAIVGQSPSPKTFLVFNSGEGMMTYSTTESSKYITSISPSSGTAPQTVTVSFNTITMPPGDFYDAITVTSAEAINSPQDLIVHYHNSYSPARIVLIPDEIELTMYECWQGPDYFSLPKTLQIENTGGDLMYWYLTHTSEWLIVSQSAGVDDAFVFLQAELYTQEFPVGSYEDTITVYSSQAINSPQVAIVTLNVIPGSEPPVIVIEKSGINIPAQEVFGTTEWRLIDFYIYNQKPGCMDFSITEDIPWFYFIDSTGSAPATVRAAVDIGDYTWGVYPDSFYVNSPGAANSPLTAYVNLLVWRLHGDFDWNNRINIRDVVSTLNYIFKGGPGPQPEYLVGDCNCDYSISVEDAVILIEYIFKGGDTPCGNP